MTITITGSDIHDVRARISAQAPRGAITIQWRGEDYGRIPWTGCIVDATAIHGEEVKRCFKTAGEAIRYIAAILKKRDAFAKSDAKRRAKEQKKEAK